MTRLAALVVLAALAGCGQRVTPPPAAGDTLHVPAFEWRMADPLALKAAYVANGQVVPDGAELHGFAGVLPDGIRLMINFAPGQAVNGPMVIDWVRPNFGGAS